MREAALLERVDDLDIDDDDVSTIEALALHDRAKSAGVALHVGCGHTPGHQVRCLRVAAGATQPRGTTGTPGGIRTSIARCARTRSLSAAPPQVRKLRRQGADG